MQSPKLLDGIVLLMVESADRFSAGFGLRLARWLPLLFSPNLFGQVPQSQSQLLGVGLLSRRPNHPNALARSRD